jgi:hypothetical protein
MLKLLLLQLHLMLLITKMKSSFKLLELNLKDMRLKTKISELKSQDMKSLLTLVTKKLLLTLQEFKKESRSIMAIS